MRRFRWHGEAAPRAAPAHEDLHARRRRALREGPEHWHAVPQRGGPQEAEQEQEAREEACGPVRCVPRVAGHCGCTVQSD